LINTVLDISKIEAGRMDVQPATFNLPPLIKLVTATTQLLVNPNVKLKAHLPSNLPPLYSDQEKIKQVLINLLSNAAKFTHQGEINLTVRQEGEMLYIDVSDTGIGISEVALGRIFEEFQQADTTTTRQYGGTGLGLPISRSLAHLLCGDLTVTSREGVGSTFAFSLPINYEQGPAIQVSQVQDHGSSKTYDQKPLVLVIDDNQDVHQLLKQNLEDAGYDVVSAYSGDEGIQKAHVLNPFAITLDIMMPDKDGWQVLHEIKTDTHTRHIPVILVSIVDEKSLGYRLGAADYLVKPLDEDAICTVLQRLTKINNGLPPKRLLVVDDDPDVFDMVSQLLEDTSYVVAYAKDGVVALEAIQEEAPDAILLDLMMPRMDGFSLISELQGNPKFRDIPFIVLTAKTLTTTELDSLQQSAGKIIEKDGLNRESLLNEIQAMLSQID
jgi:CheY-like chemotaxis protein/anti-sigma regulatory factor (Ser/Thr protein kinase)